MDDETPEPQPVTGPLTSSAIFLVVTVRPGEAAGETALGLAGDLGGLVRAVGFREPQFGLTCVMGFGSQAWDRLVGNPRPAELHPFHELRGGPRHAPATPGDLLFHIRAERFDLCFELAGQILDYLGNAVEVVDEVHGFRYFDNRDLLGFVDGTENPVGQARDPAALVGAEDDAFVGGSYVIVQKYLHDLHGWNALPTEQQELVIGRAKLSDVELADDVKPTYAHNALTVIESDGVEVDILRDNMAFGKVGAREFGTYFIGYARSPATTEQMLVNMFVGRPEGNYDRILDFSRAVTGTLFFVPSLTLLESLPAPAPTPAPPPRPGPGSSLGIGGLREP